MASIKFGFIPTEGGAFYPESLREVVRGEELGFDSIWMEEHHGVKDHYWPSPFMVLAGYATRTARVVLGTDVMVFPFYHPVRVAEDVAMLDVMSGGRAVLGAAIGYKPDEFALYGAAMEKRGARFAEGLRLIKALWTQDDVTFNGTYYRVEKAKIEPKPAQKPHPPVWVGGWGELSLRRAATLADAWLPGPTAALPKLLEGKAMYEKLRAEAGLPPQPVLPLTRDTVIADTNEQALELAERHLLVNYRDEYGGGKWKHPLIGAQDATPVNQLDALGKDRFLIGNPDRVVQGIRRFVDALGANHIIFRLFFPGTPHAHIMRSVELLAKHVIPAFR
jgi:probable F420-dependent oxidoreductase